MVYGLLRWAGDGGFEHSEFPPRASRALCVVRNERLSSVSIQKSEFRIEKLNLSPVRCSLFPVPCPLSPVPCPLYPVPCPLSLVPCFIIIRSELARHLCLRPCRWPQLAHGPGQSI